MVQLSVRLLINAYIQSILMFLVGWRPPLASVIITAVKEEVRRSCIISTSGHFVLGTGIYVVLGVAGNQPIQSFSYEDVLLLTTLSETTDWKVKPMWKWLKPEFFLARV